MPEISLRNEKRCPQNGPLLNKTKQTTSTIITTVLPAPRGKGGRGEGGGGNQLQQPASTHLGTRERTHTTLMSWEIAVQHTHVSINMLHQRCLRQCMNLLVLRVFIFVLK